MRISESKDNGPIPEERTSSNKQTKTTSTQITVLLTRGEVSAVVASGPRKGHCCPWSLPAAVCSTGLLFSSQLTWPWSLMLRTVHGGARRLQSDHIGQASVVESYSGLWLEMSAAHPLSLWRKMSMIRSSAAAAPGALQWGAVRTPCQVLGGRRKGRWPADASLPFRIHVDTAENYLGCEGMGLGRP